MRIRKLLMMLAALAATACGTAGAPEFGSANSALTPATPHYEFDVRERLTAADCDAVTGVCNITAEMREILDECNDNPPVNNTRAGCSIHIPAGEYELDEPIVLCRTHRIYGDGGGQVGARTVINVAPETTGIRVAYADECANAMTTPRRDPANPNNPPNNLPGNGSLSEIRDLALVSAGCGGSCSGGFFYGVQLQSRARLENVFVNGFTHGVHISADVNRTPFSTATTPGDEARSNANLWSLEAVHALDSAHAGVYVDGGDTNVGLGVRVNSASNCRSPAAGIVEWGDCANIIDSSFLGSTWIATHTSAVPTTAGTHAGYIAEGPSQRSLFLGAYAEGNQLVSSLSQNSIAMSGLSSWDKTTAGLRLDGVNMYGRLHVHNRFEDPDPDPATREQNFTELRLGNQDVGSYMSLHSPAMNTSWPLRIKMDLAVASDAPAQCTAGGANPLNECVSRATTMSTGALCRECVEGWYLFDVANLGAAQALRIDASARGDDSYGTLTIKEGFRINSPSGSLACPSDPDNMCAP